MYGNSWNLDISATKTLLGVHESKTIKQNQNIQGKMLN